MAIHPKIYERLKEVASNGELTTYSDIAPLVNLIMDNPDHRNQIAHILGEISTHEYKQGRPLLSAIVVHADDGQPGEGFFKMARELGLYHGKDDFENLDFFVQEVKKVHAFWKKVA